MILRCLCSKHELYDAICHNHSKFSMTFFVHRFMMILYNSVELKCFSQFFASPMNHRCPLINKSHIAFRGGLTSSPNKHPIRSLLIKRSQTPFAGVRSGIFFSLSFIQKKTCWYFRLSNFQFQLQHSSIAKFTKDIFHKLVQCDSFHSITFLSKLIPQLQAYSPDKTLFLILHLCFH